MWVNLEDSRCPLGSLDTPTSACQSGLDVSGHSAIKAWERLIGAGYRGAVDKCGGRFRPRGTDLRCDRGGPEWWRHVESFAFTENGGALDHSR